MTVHNAEIAATFERLADLLEIEGANPFRVRAYRTAARTVADLPRPAADMIADGELGEVMRVGRVQRPPVSVDSIDRVSMGRYGDAVGSAGHAASRWARRLLLAIDPGGPQTRRRTASSAATLSADPRSVSIVIAARS